MIIIGDNNNNFSLSAFCQLCGVDGTAKQELLKLLKSSVAQTFNMTWTFTDGV